MVVDNLEDVLRSVLSLGENKMRVKKLIKKLKQKYRPIVWVKKSLKKKKNQRRLLLGVGIFITLALLFFLVLAIVQQNNLQQRIIDNQAVIEKTSKEVELLKADVSSKDKTIEEKATKQAELEKKIAELDKQVTDLKSAYGGYGGDYSVNSAQYTTGNSYIPGNCTWGVKEWKSNTPNFWGNANQWDNSARASGIVVDGSPVIGAVAQTDAGWAGHVALVIGVDGSNVTIREMNFNGLYNENIRTVNSTEFNYIHI